MLPCRWQLNNVEISSINDDWHIKWQNKWMIWLLFWPRDWTFIWILDKNSAWRHPRCSCPQRHSPLMHWWTRKSTSWTMPVFVFIRSHWIDLSVESREHHFEFVSWIEYDSLYIDLVDSTRSRRKRTFSRHHGGISHSSWSNIDHSTDVLSECHFTFCFFSSSTVQSAPCRSGCDVRCFCSFRTAFFVDQSLVSVDLQIRSFTGVEHFAATARRLDSLLPNK